MPNTWEVRTLESMGLFYKQSLTLTIELASCVGTLFAIATVSLAICSYVLPIHRNVRLELVAQ